MKLIVCLIDKLSEDEYYIYCSIQSTKFESKVQHGHGSVSWSVAFGAGRRPKKGPQGSAKWLANLSLKMKKYALL